MTTVNPGIYSTAFSQPVRLASEIQTALRQTSPELYARASLWSNLLSAATVGLALALALGIREYNNLPAAAPPVPQTSAPAISMQINQILEPGAALGNTLDEARFLAKTKCGSLMSCSEAAFVEPNDAACIEYSRNPNDPSRYQVNIFKTAGQEKLFPKFEACMKDAMKDPTAFRKCDVGQIYYACNVNPLADHAQSLIDKERTINAEWKKFYETRFAKESAADRDFATGNGDKFGPGLMGHTDVRGFVIDGVRRLYPAVAAGLRTDDVITHANGQSLAGLSARDAMAKMVSDSPATLRIDVIRADGDRQSLSLNLQRVEQYVDYMIFGRRPNEMKTIPQGPVLQIASGVLDIRQAPNSNAGVAARIDNFSCLKAYFAQTSGEFTRVEATLPGGQTVNGYLPYKYLYPAPTHKYDSSNCKAAPAP